ncbi:hypothetical protein B0T09DRAFT_257360, partial [Sordaria sp. MPI-SDFR-AT-0083]
GDQGDDFGAGGETDSDHGHTAGRGGVIPGLTSQPPSNDSPQASHIPPRGKETAEAAATLSPRAQQQNSKQKQRQEGEESTKYNEASDDKEKLCICNEIAKATNESAATEHHDDGLPFGLIETQSTLVPGYKEHAENESVNPADLHTGPQKSP